MKTKIFFSLVTLLILGALLFSCGVNSEKTDDVDVNAVRTEAVATFASSLTETVAAHPTISPTPTIEPTLTFTPNANEEPLLRPVMAQRPHHPRWDSDEVK